MIDYAVEHRKRRSAGPRGGTMKNRWPILVLLLLAALNAGCSASSVPNPIPEQDGGLTDGGTRPDGGRSDAGQAAAITCATLNEARCKFLQRCELIPSSATALERCATELAATWCNTSRWPARVEAGASRADPLAAQACGQELRDAGRSCGLFEALPEVCQQLSQPNGFFNYSCYADADCREGVCRGAACPRVCQARGSVGEPCDETSDCVPDAGLHCKLSSASGGVGECMPLSAAGEACASNLDCRTGLHCSGNLSCAARTPTGFPCSPQNAPCLETAFCRYSSPNAPAGSCTALGAANQACEATSHCQQGLVCVTTTLTCQPAGPLAAGTPCGPPQRCADGLTCQPLPGAGLACQPAVGIDGGCRLDDECRLDLTCDLPGDGGPGRCGPRHADGTPCDAHRDCQHYSRCQGTSCTPLPGVGSPCLQDSCLYGACDRDAGVDGGLCVGLGRPGASCTRDVECGSERCVSGRCQAACAP
jgi:hypothetical protein